MRFPWVIVGGTGYDVEDIGNPRTHDMECPSCGKTVRFVEKELIKNLRVFGVPLVGVEKGRRVFECPHCKVCVEPPDEEPEAENTAPSDAKREALQARLAKLDDEIWLWNQRANMAASKGARDLEFEALEWKTKAEREADALREVLAKAPAAAAAPRKTERDAKGPAIVARKGGEIVDRGAEDDFAALKARLARKQTEPQPSEATGAPTETRTEPVKTEPAQTEPTTVSEPAATSDVVKEPDVEHDFEALKAKLAQRGAPETPKEGTGSAYESLRSELSRPAADQGPAPTSPGGGGGDDDDDHVAALKKKLRGK